MNTTCVYVVMKHVFEEFYDGGIKVCGVYSREGAALARFAEECGEALKFINENAIHYPSGIRVFGTNDYWTAFFKEQGLSKNIIEIFVAAVPFHTCENIHST